MEWIDIITNKPNNHELCYVTGLDTNGDRFYSSDIFSDGDWCYFSQKNIDSFGDVSHWMRLEPPTVE